MRAVRTLLLAAALSAIAMAMPSIQDASKDAARHLAELSNALPVMHSSHHHPRHMKHVSHLFGAKQTTDAAGTCDTAAFAEATSRVVQACPSLSGLVSGTTAPEEFLPTFCASECYQVLVVEFKKNRGCIDGQTLFLVGMISMCETRPHCYTKAVVTEQITFDKDCGAGLKAVGNVSLVDTATVDLAVSTCAGTCRSRMKDLYTKYPECMVDPLGIPTPYGPLAAVLDFMCSSVGGEICTKSLRGLSRLDCQTSTCSNTQYWCKANGASCDINPTADNLKSLCTSCLDGLIAIADAPGSKGGDAIRVVASRELICGRVNPADASSNLCYLTASTSFGVGMAAMKASTFTSATNDAMCAGDNLKCLPRNLALSATLAQVKARDTFKKCVGTSGKTVASCQPALEADLANAEMVRTMSTLVCEDNRLPSPYNMKCLTTSLAVVGFVTSACQSLCAAGGATAIMACNASANTVTSIQGCCAALADPFVAAMLPTTFQGNFLPPGAQSVAGKAVTFTAANANAGTIDRTKRPLQSVVNCQTMLADSTTAWTSFEAKCPARSATTERSLKLFASFERANAKPGLMLKLANALRGDIANNLGVPVNWIINFGLTEDTTVKVNLRVKAARRQVAAGTGNGMKFTFSIDGAAAADVTAAVALFDARVSAGTLYAPSGASTMEDECTDCSDAYSSSMVRPAVQQTTMAPGTFLTTLAAGSAASVSAVFAAAVAGLLLVIAA